VAADALAANKSTAELLGLIYADSRAAEVRETKVLSWTRVAEWSALAAVAIGVVGLIVTLAVS